MGAAGAASAPAKRLTATVSRDTGAEPSLVSSTVTARAGPLISPGLCARPSTASTDSSRPVTPLAKVLEAASATGARFGGRPGTSTRTVCGTAVGAADPSSTGLGGAVGELVDGVELVALAEEEPWPSEPEDRSSQAATPAIT